MNRTLSITLVALLLCACKPAPSPTAATDAAAAATTAAASATPATQAAPPAAPAVASTAAVPPGTSAPNASAAMPVADVDRAARVDAVNQSIDTALGDHAKYEPVIHAFQQAVANGDRQAVAALVEYPISVSIDGKPSKVKDAQAFVAAYDKIMSQAIAKAIIGQEYADLFVNDQGVMFGSGEAWISGVCRDNACKKMDVKVITLQPAAQ